MKRLTETEKWRDPWFQALSIKHKALWMWMCDHVDTASVVDISWPLCSFECSTTITEEDVTALGDRVEKLQNGKHWLPKFVIFQYGELSPSEKKDKAGRKIPTVHNSILKALVRHGLEGRVAYKAGHTPSSTLTPALESALDSSVEPAVAPTAKEKVKVKVKEPEKEPAEARPAVESDHAKFIRLWSERHLARFGEKYLHKQGKDGKAVKTLLGTGLTPEALLAIAEQAWGNIGKEKKFWAEKAVTIFGFAANYSNIKAEGGMMVAHKDAETPKPQSADYIPSFEEQMAVQRRIADEQSETAQGDDERAAAAAAVAELHGEKS